MMAGSALSPLAGFAQNEKITNWAGNFTYGTGSVFHAGSLDAARDLIKKYPKLKVLGTRHCFNNIADSHDHFLSLAQLNKVVALDEHSVTVEAGVKYGELAVMLNDKGYALHNLASLPHISVAGGCATATHGSGVHNGNLSSAVMGMELITAGGDTVSLSRHSESFGLAVIHLGGLGAVSKITLAIQPSYQIRQYVYEDLPMSALATHFDEIMGAGYSVSLFTDWRNNNVSEVWIKSKDASFSSHPVFYGARSATKNLHPIRNLGAENCTEQMGVPGPWHERLPHFRMGFTPSSGKELQSEYFVPREHSYAAIKAVEQLHEKIAPHLFISEIRCIDADQLPMSPCYHQPSTAIHFTWKPEWPEVRQLLPLIEQQLAPYNARPHWGKLFTMPHQRLATLYPKMHQLQQLMRHYDPTGKFRNEYLDKVIFGS